MQDQTLAAKLADYQKRGVSRIKLGLTDIDGVIRGKYLSLDKFKGLLADGGGFCDCVFGWDADDQLYDSGEYTGWHSGFPDARYRLLAGTERWLADENCPYFVGEFVGEGDAPHPLCPRTQLRQALARLAQRGLTLKSGFEYEFFVFEETPHSVRDKGYRNLKPLTPGNFGYSLLRTAAQGELFAGLMDHCQALGLDLEGLHCETGPGVWEAALAACSGVEAADRANLFKTFAKAFFQKRGLMPPSWPSGAWTIRARAATSTSASPTGTAPTAFRTPKPQTACPNCSGKPWPAWSAAWQTTWRS